MLSEKQHRNYIDLIGQERFITSIATSVAEDMLQGKFKVALTRPKKASVKMKPGAWATKIQSSVTP